MPHVYQVSRSHLLWRRMETRLSEKQHTGFNSIFPSTNGFGDGS
jgi:hypothetical protein